MELPMRNHGTPLTRPSRRSQVCVVEGYDVRIHIKHGRLVVEDGIGERRQRIYSRATAGISRLVVIGHAGLITLEAIRWCADLGIALLHIDRDGRVLASTAVEGGDSRLRRTQALAPATETGLEISRELLRAKLNGQARVLDQLRPTTDLTKSFADSMAALEAAETIEQLVWAERDAALAYWAAWAPVEIRFRASDAARLAEHWLVFGQRGSPLTTGPRLAVNPANALLNYLYALLEAETRIACLTVGLDPTLGIVHTDHRKRDSLVLDLMEAARPDVDQLVLDLLQDRVFKAADFAETRRGVCRIVAPLAHELAATTLLWRSLVAPVCERVAATFASAPGSRVERTPTPLTGARRRAANPRRRPRAALTRHLPECRGCGQPVPKPDRAYCDDCLALPQEQRHNTTRGLPMSDPETVTASLQLEPGGPVARATSRRCKRCGDQVSHRKRVLCDPCFVEFRAELAVQRRPCKTCGQPVPHRKRTYCDACLAGARRPPERP
jgi:CRISPR-associated protein Cas1